MSALTATTILKYYLSPDFAPISAYAVISGCLFFPFVMTGLLATDLGFTLRNHQLIDQTRQDRHNKAMDIWWQLVYWLNFTFAMVLKRFYVKYWISGHFTWKLKAKDALRRLAIQAILAILLISLVLGFSWYYMGSSVLQKGSVALILLNCIWGMLCLVLLLAYGVAKLPITLWEKSNTEL